MTKKGPQKLVESNIRAALNALPSIAFLTRELELLKEDIATLDSMSGNTRQLHESANNALHELKKLNNTLTYLDKQYKSKRS